MMIVWLAVGCAVGALAGSAFRGGGQPGLPREGERGNCSVSLCFLRRTEQTPGYIDVITGRTGITHIVVDACETGPDGEHIVYDCTQHVGVARVPWSQYSERLAHRIVLPMRTGLELRGCLAAQVGMTYDIQRNCASIIAGCLPGYDGPPTPTPSELLQYLHTVK